MNAMEKLKEYKKRISELSARLDDLEKEKAEIIQAYKSADEKTREEILKKMQKSEEKFKNLCDEMLELSAKVKKLKNQ